MGIGVAEVERIVVRLVGQGSSFDAMMDQADKRIDKIALKAQAIGASLSKYVTVPLAGMGAASLKAYSDFDQAMTQSLSIMTGVDDAMRKRLEDQAKVVGRGSQSATQLAESYYFLASAGLDAEQSIAALPIVQRFSTAGAFDMAKATDLLTDAQTALGMSSRDAAINMRNMEEIGDKIAKSANIANASMLQFSDSLTTDSATSARNFGQSLDSLLATLSAYASKGIKASEAGNLYGRATRLLTKSYRDNQEIFEQLNVQVVDSEGNYRNFIDIIGDMERAFEGMTLPQRDATLELMGFDALAQKSITPLIGMASEMRRYEEIIANAGGTMDTMANKQMKSFQNQIKRTTNLLMVVAIEVGEVLAPSVLRMNNAIERSLTWWRSLSDETKRFVITVAKIAAATGPLLLVLGKTYFLVKALVPQLVAAASAAKYLFGIMRVGALVALLPFIKVIAIMGAVAGAVAAVTYVVAGPEGMANAWNYATSSVKWFYEKSMGFMENFSENVSAISTWLSNNWQSLVIDLATSWFNMTVTMAQNYMVGIRLVMRLFATFEGWLVGRAIDLWNYVWSTEFLNTVAKGLSMALTKFADWSLIVLGYMEGLAIATTALLMEIPKAFFGILGKLAEKMGPILIKLITGELDPAALMAEFAGDIAGQMAGVAVKGVEAFNKHVAPLADKALVLGETLTSDFMEGVNNQNLGEALGKVFADEMGNFQNPFDQLKIRNLDELKLNLTRATEDVVDAADAMMAPIADAMDMGNLVPFDPTADGLDKVGSAAVAAAEKVGDLNKELNGVADWDAIEASSAEAFYRLYEHQQARAGASISAGTAIGGGVAPLQPAGTSSPSEMITILTQIEENTRPDSRQGTRGGMPVTVIRRDA